MLVLYLFNFKRMNEIDGVFDETRHFCSRREWILHLSIDVSQMYEHYYWPSSLSIRFIFLLSFNHHHSLSFLCCLLFFLCSFSFVVLPLFLSLRIRIWKLHLCYSIDTFIKGVTCVMSLVGQQHCTYLPGYLASMTNEMNYDDTDDNDDDNDNDACFL